MAKAVIDYLDYVMHFHSMKNNRVFLWPLDLSASKQRYVCLFLLAVHVIEAARPTLLFL